MNFRSGSFSINSKARAYDFRDSSMDELLATGDLADYSIVHAGRAELCRRVDETNKVDPPPVAELNRAVAVGMRDGDAEGLRLVGSVITIVTTPVTLSTRRAGM